ncbi:MAG: integration host factor subunit beta [Treponema sp.]|jgi:integration host factor subunit beta|nr:integration host factor subunit beta [Treponema sp.]
MTEKKYTKADLIDSVYRKTRIDRKEVQTIIECFLDTIQSGLLEEATLELRGFGTFEFKIRKGREKARNPKTGATLSVQAHGAVTFRPGRKLKQDLWGLGTERGAADFKDREVYGQDPQ